MPASNSSSHSYSPSSKEDSRAPCPALNALANHGYLPHSGTGITFIHLVQSLTSVYNLSLPLVLALAVPAFLIYGKWRWSGWRWQCTLDLAALSEIGPWKIAHVASLVHPNSPSHAPDPTLLHDFLSYAESRSADAAVPVAESESQPLTADQHAPGLNLHDLAHLRVIREAALPPPLKLDSLHDQLAVGEGGLAWLLMRTSSSHQKDENDSDIIPFSRLSQWFGDEKLPDDWFNGGRPQRTIGLLRARGAGNRVHREMEIIRGMANSQS